MKERDPKIVQSDLSRTVKEDGVTVEVLVKEAIASAVSVVSKPMSLSSLVEYAQELHIIPWSLA
jgi:hypothetical protein